MITTTTPTKLTTTTTTTAECNSKYNKNINKTDREKAQAIEGAVAEKQPRLRVLMCLQRSRKNTSDPEAQAIAEKQAIEGAVVIIFLVVFGFVSAASVELAFMALDICIRVVTVADSCWCGASRGDELYF